MTNFQEWLIFWKWQFFGTREEFFWPSIFYPLRDLGSEYLRSCSFLKLKNIALKGMNLIALSANRISNPQQSAPMLSTLYPSATMLPVQQLTLESEQQPRQPYYSVNHLLSSAPTLPHIKDPRHISPNQDGFPHTQPCGCPSCQHACLSIEKLVAKSKRKQ